MVFHPTYDQYRRILSDIIQTGNYCDYLEAAGRTRFIILRHDIEFSVERAFLMAKLETNMGIRASYFVQIRNDAYNAFSLNNTWMLQEMYHNGHKIGLHYHIGESTDPVTVGQEIEEQCRLMEEMLHIPIDRYSMHRPQKETKYYATAIPGLINAYGADFFTFSDEIEEDTQLRVKYISDARYQWNYGSPDKETLTNCERIQLLIHPDYWSAGQSNLEDQFVSLVQEHKESFIRTIDNECKQFHPVRELVVKRV